MVVNSTFTTAFEEPRDEGGSIERGYVYWDSVFFHFLRDFKRGCFIDSRKRTLSELFTKYRDTQVHRIRILSMKSKLDYRLNLLFVHLLIFLFRAFLDAVDSVRFDHTRVC